MQIVHANFGELSNAERANPVGTCRCSGASCSPAQAVDFRVVYPRYFGERGTVAEVIQEEHRSCGFSKRCLLLGLDLTLANSESGDQIPGAAGQGAVQHHLAASKSINDQKAAKGREDVYCAIHTREQTSSLTGEANGLLEKGRQIVAQRVDSRELLH